MQKLTVELTEPELKVIANALKYAKAYKGLEVYEAVLHKIVDQLTEGVPRYYVVQGTLDDGICRCSKAIMVKAKSKKQALSMAMGYLETDTGEIFRPTAVGVATKDYGLCEVLYR